MTDRRVRRRWRTRTKASYSTDDNCGPQMEAAGAMGLTRIVRGAPPSSKHLITADGTGRSAGEKGKERERVGKGWQGHGRVAARGRIACADWRRAPTKGIQQREGDSQSERRRPPSVFFPSFFSLSLSLSLVQLHVFRTKFLFTETFLIRKFVATSVPSLGVIFC